MKNPHKPLQTNLPDAPATPLPGDRFRFVLASPVAQVGHPGHQPDPGFLADLPGQSGFSSKPIRLEVSKAEDIPGEQSGSIATTSQLKETPIKESDKTNFRKLCWVAVNAIVEAIFCVEDITPSAKNEREVV